MNEELLLQSDQDGSYLQGAAWEIEELCNYWGTRLEMYNDGTCAIFMGDLFPTRWFSGIWIN